MYLTQGKSLYSRSLEKITSYFSGSDLNVEIAPSVFSADIDFLVLLSSTSNSITLYWIHWVPLHNSPLPVVFLVSLASLASGTIDILIAATSTEVLLTLSWINICHAIYFIVMALHFLS